jgi:hypothetical protein
MLEGEQLASILREMKVNEEDLANLYRGLWRTLGPVVTPGWAADVICMFETLGPDQQEPWHSFMEFVRNKRAQSFLESLHPEVGEAIVALMKELEGENTSVTFDTLHPSRRGVSRRRTKADKRLN